MTTNELFRQHVGIALSQFGGNLTGFKEALKADEIPGESDARIPQLMEELKAGLNELGYPENDSFLLRYGLIVPGLFRGIKPPIECVFPTRGGLSKRRIEEASSQILRLREALAVISVIMDVNSDTKAALVMISELSGYRLPDEAWVDQHASLSEEEARSLAQQAFECFDHPSKTVQRIGESILAALADYRDQPLPEVTTELVRRHIHWPQSLFRNASDEIASILIDRIDKGEKPNGGLMLSLAWTRTETARAAFAKWQANPISSDSRFKQPSDQMTDAGWCLDENGKRRDLISLPCFRLTADVATQHLAEVRCRVPEDRSCPACKGPLSWLFDFTAAPTAVFNDRAYLPRRVLACLHCAAFGKFFTRYSRDGFVDVHPTTTTQGFGYFESDRAPCSLYLRSKEWPPFAGAKPFALANGSTLGGIPMWVQSAEYPECPQCEKTMPFFAQFDCGSQKGEEGIYYAFFCEPCRIGAVTYQQT